MQSNKKPNRLFVGSLPYKITEGDLLALFVGVGKVVAVKVLRNPWGRSRGIGFVEFEDSKSARAAKEKFNGYYLIDRTIIVDYAKPDPAPEKTSAHLIESKPFPGASAPVPPNPSSPRASRKRKPFGSTRPAKLSTFSAVEHKKGNFQKMRQTVFDQRHHHSRVGAKFSRRQKSRPTT